MTRIQKMFIPVMALSLSIIVFSCNNGSSDKKDEKQADTSQTKPTAEVVSPVFTPFKVLVVKHKVANYAKWKAAYEAHDSVRNAYGISSYHLGRGLEDSNLVVVIDKMTDLQKAKDFSTLPALKDVMKKAGVISKPEFAFVEEIRADTSKVDQMERVMVVHHVKDFAAWLKVYDGEGKATRMANGMMDRAMGRGVEDSNMVYLVFVVTDMAKAKARGNSPELKKIMQDAGVNSPPQIFFYRLDK